MKTSITIDKRIVDIINIYLGESHSVEDIESSFERFLEPFELSDHAKRQSKIIIDDTYLNLFSDYIQLELGVDITFNALHYSLDEEDRIIKMSVSLPERNL